MFVLQTMTADQGRTVARMTYSYDCSHLCHNKRCSNPDHVVLELHIINLDRDTCPVSEICGCCNKVVVWCVHDPKCLKKP